MKSHDKHKIIVVGLPSSATSDDLIKLAKPFGNPLDANLAVDAEGRPRGFAFVRFADDDAAKAAIEKLDKTELGGRTLHVRAVEQRDAPKPAGAAKGRPCFDFAKGRCKLGAACKWVHAAPSADGATSRRPEWQKSRPSADAASALLADIPENYCRKFQLGTCHRGKSCKWEHKLWKGSWSPMGGLKRGNASTATADEAEAPLDDASSKRARPSPATPGEVRRDVATPSASEVRVMLAHKVRAWEERCGEGEGEGGVSTSLDEAKNRDVCWRALERIASRIE